MWPSLIGKAKLGGLDVIQTYVFWNVHEPQPGQVRKKKKQKLPPLPDKSQPNNHFHRLFYW